jgi:hypothetical protein
MEKLCSVCNKKVDSETAAILTIGGYGNPKYICEECDGDFAEATGAKDIEAIKAAMDRISKKMTAIDQTDGLVLGAVGDIMEEASERAKKIQEGTYDFSAEKTEDLDGEQEIPEELRETEEDKELDRKEAERNKKLDKIVNWVSAIALLGVLGYAIYRLIANFI